MLTNQKYQLNIVPALQNLRAKIKETNVPAQEGAVLAIATVSCLPGLTDEKNEINGDWVADALESSYNSDRAYLIMMDDQLFPSWWYESELHWVKLA